MHSADTRTAAALYFDYSSGIINSFIDSILETGFLL